MDMGGKYTQGVFEKAALKTSLLCLFSLLWIGVIDKVEAQERPAAAAAQKGEVNWIDNYERLVNEIGRLRKAGRDAEAVALAKKLHSLAERLFRRTVAIRQKVLGPEHPDTATSLSKLGSLYYSTGSYSKAAPLLQRALAIREKALGPAHPSTTTSLNNLAALYDVTGEYARAEPLYLRALTIRQEVLGPEHPDTATSLNNLAMFYYSTGAYGKAEPLFQRAVAVFEKARGPEHADTATSVNNLAMLYLATGAYDEAESLLQRALAIDEKARGPEHPDTATRLNNLASLYEETGADDKAEPLIQRAIAIFEKAFGPEHPDTATSLNNLAVLYRKTGAYGKAEPLHQRALAIQKKALGPEHPDTAVSLNNLAALYRATGAYGKAAPLYRRALAIREKVLGPKHPDTAVSVNNLALLYDTSGAYGKAAPLYRRALANSEEVLGPDHAATATSLNNLAMLYHATGAYDKAAPLFQRALTIRENALGPEHPNTAQSLNNLALLYATTGAYDKAEPLYQRALTGATMARDPELLFTVFINLATFYEARDDVDSSVFFGKQAVNVVQGLRSEMTTLDKKLRKSFVKTKSHVFRYLADRLIDQGRLQEAQQVLEMLKDEEYFDFVRRDASERKEARRASFTQTEQRSRERFQAIRGKLVELGKELGALRKNETLTATEQARVKVLLADLDIGQQAFAAALEEMRNDFAKLRKERSNQLAARQLDSSRTGLVSSFGEGTVLLQYIVLDDAVRILLTTANVQKAYRIAKTQTDLNQIVFSLQAALRDPNLDPRPAGKALYEVLIQPAAEDLKQGDAKTLMVSLDGVLRYIPVAALHDGNRYVAEQYAVSVFTEAASGNMTQTPAAWRVAGMGVTKAHPGFKALTGARRELESIVKTKTTPNGILEGSIYFDENFTKDTFRESLLNHFPVIHVASHFQFNPGTERDSFLLMGDGTRLDLGELRTGYFDFKDLDLLTLSACETAVGGGQGTEVENMAVIAQKKNAKAVLATLWPVADQTTAALIKQMYSVRERGISDKGRALSKAEALRQAQRDLYTGKIGAGITPPQPNASLGKVKSEQARENSRNVPKFQTDPKRPFAHPYYWAPFILMGNWL
jgi:CHAT domain-containing protein/Tfp pilus assembly protein PilF